MLTEAAAGVWIHESECIQSNSIVVESDTGVLLIDPGLTEDELVTIAEDLGRLGKPVVTGFSTHPHWDHVLWHAALGDAPRYGTARCAAEIASVVATPGWQDELADELPPEVAGQIPFELFGRIIGLPAGTVHVPWDGPAVRIIEHRGHSQGHAALLIEDRGVLVAGDMLSDVLIPMLDFAAPDPIGDYLAALDLLNGLEADVVIPGHGSAGGAGQLRSRIDQDRAYLEALRDGRDSADPRTGPAAQPGWEWVADVDAGQRQFLAART